MLEQFWLDITYIVSSACFIFGIKLLSSPDTARSGNALSALGMAVAVLFTFLGPDIVNWYQAVLVIAIGSVLGVLLAVKVQLTSMPEMVALLNGSGGVASLLIALAAYISGFDAQGMNTTSVGSLIAIALAILIGGITTTGSVIAYLKLSEKISGRPFLFNGQQIVNGLLLVAMVALVVMITVVDMPYSDSLVLICALVILAAILGIMAVIPIGGADMPVVISLLNSYSGLAACAAGFIINNNLLIVAGSMVGASGIILTKVMCRAMNRSLANVLFSGFGAVTTSIADGKEQEGEVRPAGIDDAWALLEAASSVIFVPGYGMAVAQAQHLVRELGELLEENGAEVKYAIHPVAGRMPGHMNVLLAEANVPYDMLYDQDAVNPIMDSVDVAVIIGANDVVNPAATDDQSSPLYGMPVIEVQKARTVLVLKRSMASGFAGVQNGLFFKSNTRMVFGDAKETFTRLVAQFKS